MMSDQANHTEPDYDPRGAVRTLAELYDLPLADAARVYEGEANASVDRGLHD